MREISADNQEFVRLVLTYEKLIFTVCYRLIDDYFDAEDLAQDTFLSAYKHMSEFDGKNEKAWLVKIATNKCLDYLKNKQRLSIPTSESALSLYPSSQDIDGQYENKEVSEMLESACRKLKEPYNEIAYEYYCVRKSAAQIARERSLKVKTVQMQIYRAREKLRKELSENGFK